MKYQPAWILYPHHEWTSNTRRSPYLRVSWWHEEARTEARTSSPHETEGNISIRTQDEGNGSDTRAHGGLLKGKSDKGPGRAREMTQKVGEKKCPQRARYRKRNSYKIPILKMINERFQSYFRENLFAHDEEGFSSFLKSLERPLSKTIRIKPGKGESVKRHLEKDGYILKETTIPSCFEIDRIAEFNPLERRLGYALDHLVGNFYIQELAAAHPVDILANSTIHDEPFLILDMASSPGGKTTQLAEYFPKSFIIANEPTRERIPQLLQNLDRMGSLGIAVTLYPGQYFARETEVFDRILLDAPCSGEGTAFR